MKKIIYIVITTMALLGLLFKTLNPNQQWSNQNFLEYMAECPQVNIEDVVSTIQSDWGTLDFLRTLFNTIITVFNFAIKIIGNLTQAIIYIVYAINYFFNIADINDNQNTPNGGGGGSGWRGGA